MARCDCSLAPSPRKSSPSRYYPTASEATYPNLTPVNFSFPLRLLELQASFGIPIRWLFAVMTIPLVLSMVIVSGAQRLATFLPLQPSDRTSHGLAGLGPVSISVAAAKFI